MFEERVDVVFINLMHRYLYVSHVDDLQSDVFETGITQINSFLVGEADVWLLWTKHYGLFIVRRQASSEDSFQIFFDGDTVCLLFCKLCIDFKTTICFLRCKSNDRINSDLSTDVGASYFLIGGYL